MATKCKNHPQKDAVGACIKCGNFFCEECLIKVRNKNYCKECVEDLIGEGGEIKPIMFQQQQQQQMGGREEPDAGKETNWGLIIKWFISIFFFLLAISGFISKSFGAIFALIIGILWLPPLEVWLKNKHNFEIPSWIKILLTVVLTIFMGIMR